MGAQTNRSGTDTYYRATLDRDVSPDIVGASEAVASEQGVSMAKLALAWVLSRPGITAPIVSETKLQHLDDAIESVRLTLSEEECKQLEAPSAPISVTAV